MSEKEKQKATGILKTVLYGIIGALIGAAIGGRNHATVLHSCKAVANLMDTDRKFRSMMDEIRSKILGCA